MKQQVLYVLGCITAGIMTLALTSVQAQITIVEADFEEVLPGAKIVDEENLTDPSGEKKQLFPKEGRFHSAFAQDRVMIVEAWDGNALQFQDKVEGASARLVFGSNNLDAFMGGRLEVSLDFRIDAPRGTSYSGHPLQVILYTPEAGHFLQVLVLKQNGKIAYTNSDTPPVSENMTSGEMVQPGTVYQLELMVSLDNGTYSLQLIDKETGNVFYHATELLYVKTPELIETGVGKGVLNLFAGSPDFSQDIDPPVTVTIDNILVRHYSE